MPPHAAAARVEQRRHELSHDAQTPGLEVRGDEPNPPAGGQLKRLAPSGALAPRQAGGAAGPVGVRFARLEDLHGSHARHRRAASSPSKTSVWRSTSASVVAGHISAMLWNGVMRMPRL